MAQLSFTQAYETARDVVISTHIHCHPEAQRTLHFLHGNGFAVRSYDVLLEALVQQDNLMLQDAPGHGLSPTGARFLGWNKTASNFLNVIEQLQSLCSDFPVIGLGHSFGGCMTLLMSARTSSLFEQNILLDPALYPPKMIWLLNSVRWSGLKRKFPLVRQTERRRTSWSSPEAAYDALFNRGTFKGWDERCLKDYIQYATHQAEDGTSHLNCPTWLEAAVFGSAPAGLWRIVKTLTTPTYILWGNDTYDMFKQAYFLAASLNPNIKLIQVRGGHCFMLQYPEQTGRLVRSLLEYGESGAHLVEHADFVIPESR